MHVFQSRFLRRGEVWFNQEPDQTPVDWIYYRQRPSQVHGAKWRYFHTLMVDLESSPEALLKSFNQSTRYKIKRARDADRFICESASPITPDVLENLAQVYKPFAARKGLGPLDRSRLEQLAKDGCLDLSFVRAADGTALAYHVYYRAAHRSCLMHSISFHQAMADSAARSAAARANCLLTWCDMLRHKEQGLNQFDFGGWYTGNTDQARLDINQFKQGFGGTVVRECNCEQILTLRGRVVLAVAALLDRAQTLAKEVRMSGQRRTPSERPALLVDQPADTQRDSPRERSGNGSPVRL